MASKLLPAACFSLISCCASAAPLDLHLDFNDNLLPAGWSIRPGPLNRNSNYGVAGGRYFAGEVDSSSFLSLPYAPSAGVTSLQVDWQGSVFQTYWGNNEGVNVVDAAGNAFLTRTESNDYLYGTGIRTFIGADAAPVYELRPLPAGDYDFSAVFSNGQIAYTGSLAGTVMFSMTQRLQGFSVANLRAIELVVYETTGPDSWIDNVHIVEQTSAVPELASLPAMLLGLMGLGCVGLHRTRQASQGAAAG